MGFSPALQVPAYVAIWYSDPHKRVALHSTTAPYFISWAPGRFPPPRPKYPVHTVHMVKVNTSPHARAREPPCFAQEKEEYCAPSHMDR